MMIGTSLSARISLQTAQPSITGIITSSSSMSGLSDFHFLMPSTPFSASSTV